MLFEIKDLKYKNVLNIPTLTIKKGEITILSGKSGSGKSLLFSLLTAKDYNYEGDILLEGISIKNQPVSEAFKKIAFLDQEYILLGTTVAEEFTIICNFLNIDYDENKILELLKCVDLSYSLSTQTHNFSGGEKQRLCIARTFYVNKEIIMLDEPTSALDETNVINIMKNLQKYIQNSNKSVVMISHDKNIINDEKYNHIDLGDYNG